MLLLDSPITELEFPSGEVVCVGTFGERLQREREMRGITLEEIAEATKIGTRSLRALEEQDFDKLPGGIFNKGFVRAYSKYLGIDEDQAVADYQTAVNEAQAAGKVSRPEYVPPEIQEAERPPEPVRIPWSLLIGIALVVVVGFAAKSYYSQHGWAKLRRQPTPKAVQSAPAPPVEQPSASTPVPEQTTAATVPAGAQPSSSPIVVPKAPSPDPPKKTSVPPSVTATAADSFVVKVRATEVSWVSVQADGKTVFSETMQPNSDHQFRAGKEIVVVTGNAAGIELSHNDKLLPSLGQEGQKKTVVLTAQGVQQPQQQQQQ